jgi:hypothetical protein
MRKTISLVVLLLTAVALRAETVASSAQTGYDDAAAQECGAENLGSPFIPVDSWIYPAVLRLYSLGYVDNIYVGMRTWTRAGVNNLLDQVNEELQDTDAGPARDEAEGIYNSLLHELNSEGNGPCLAHHGRVQVESVYSATRAISGTPLRDSFHLGSTIVNDYGRPYSNGVNNYSGMGAYATAGRFALYVRGEFQGAPSATGYSAALYQTLSGVDMTVNPVTGVAYPGQSTIPLGPIGSKAQGRFLEAYVSARLLGHVLSFGKQDEWMGSAVGGAMAYSNNAENIYALHINRTDPLYVPLLSRLTGPFRYEFLVGALRGHMLMPNPLYANNPSVQANVISSGNPWVHAEKVSFRPTVNLEFGFERTVIWGGRGHTPITLHSFLKSFFSVQNVVLETKDGRSDPGARFGSFDFSYRLPWARKWLTLYGDGEVHDDVSPIDAPRRAAWRPGLYLSHVPGVPKLDLRAEAVTTDPPITNSSGGRFMYWEYILKQGYTNQGQMFGDWMGREAKGGQAWITYHLSGNEWVQASVRTQKAAKDFIPGGTTLNNFDFQVVKRIGHEFEIGGNFTFEHWKAPIYMTGQQTVTATTIQLTWHPNRKISF